MVSPSEIFSESDDSVKSSDPSIIVRKPIAEKPKKKLNSKQLKKQIISQLDQIMDGYHRQNPFTKAEKTKGEK